MKKIILSHNPYLVETSIQLDGGEQLSDGNKLKERLDHRLQMWVESFFDDLDDELNGFDRIELDFLGTESDFNDLRLSAESFIERKPRRDIQLSHRMVESDLDRIEKIMAMYKEAMEGPLQGWLDMGEFQKRLEIAMEPRFPVYVIAPMKAGKSTFINALIGADLAPSAVEACTATIAEFRDKDGMEKFRARRLDQDGNEIEGWAVDEDDTPLAKTLEEWNKDSNTHKIVIEGNFPAIKEQKHASLVLIDTPGPNNARDDRHGQLTHEIIDNEMMPMVLYVVNSCQNGTVDDNKLLDYVRRAMDKPGKRARERFLFIVNKADVFDSEKGEKVEDTIETTERYLEENHKIKGAYLYPVSALTAKLARIAQRNGKLTNKEIIKLQGLEQMFREEPSMHFEKLMTLSPSVLRKVQTMLEETEKKDDQRTEALVHTGVPVVELVIEEYLHKYAFPMRIENAHEVLKKFFKIAVDKANVIGCLEEAKTKIGDIEKELSAIKNKHEKGDHSRRFREELKNEPWMPDNEIDTERDNIQKKWEKSKIKIGKTLQGENIETSEAEDLFEKAKHIAEEAAKEVVNKLNGLLETSYSNECKRLIDLYRKYIVDLFGGKDDQLASSLPALDKLKTAAQSMLTPHMDSLYKDACYTKEITTGSFEVYDGELLKPWTWFSWRTVDQKENRDFTNLSQAWEGMQATLSNFFNKVTEDAKKHMVESCKKARERFIKLMDERLDKEIKNLLGEMKTLASDKTKLEMKAEESEKVLGWIKDFNERLDQILSFTSNEKAGG